jgi:lycopene cyclase domain-containing protein
MMEYTICAVVSAFVTAVLDARLGTRVLRNRSFWIFQGVMVFFAILSNGYLTGRPIVIYGEAQYLGIRLGTIPVEDFIYGFSLTTLSVILWEYLGRRDSSKDRAG